METDIVIAGGGLAGSLAASMLARGGFDVTLVDPHEAYPPDLRCEKLVGRQVEILKRTGLADRILRAATLDGECWIARFGRVVERCGGDQWGILYDTLVNTVRGTIPAGTPFVCGKVTQVANGPERQAVTLASGERLSARLVILATGLNASLRGSLGIVRKEISKCHCVTLAFDVKPVGRANFDFRALTWFGERAADRVAYLTLFPVGQAMRANLMVYREMDDPWLRDMKERPEVALLSVLPGIGRVLGETEIVGPVRVRPADLFVMRGYRQPGVVLVGDAFATSCPASGAGTDKVLTDVERLCNVHVPRWMASSGMGAGKIESFYDDPVKRACDRWSFNRAFSGRSVSIDPGWSGRSRRWARFLGQLAIGTAREKFRALVRPGPAGKGRPT